MFIDFFSFNTEFYKHIQFKKKEKMENLGIDPSTSRMLSGRSTIWANPPTRNTSMHYKLELHFFLH